MSYLFAIPISLSRPKSAIYEVLFALVKDSRQFKHREKQLLKVVTVNLPYIIQTTIILSNVGEAVPQKWRENVSVTA